MSHIGCKHLDYTSDFIDCELRTIEPEGWKYWERMKPFYEGMPTKVQFCGAGRGRINEIFACINPGEMPCFKPQSTEKEKPPQGGGSTDQRSTRSQEQCTSNGDEPATTGTEEE